MIARGTKELRSIVGKRLTGARRYVLGLGNANDAFGHGVTEFTFEDERLVIRPGPNEDYLVLERGPLDASALNSEYWSEVDLVQAYGWLPSGHITHVDVFTDGVEDVALVFHTNLDASFSVVLCDTDVALGQRLERFDSDPNGVRPILRTRID